MYKGGDCDDLSILFCSLFEAVGVRTAFITIPGHIFMAFDSGMTVEQAQASLESMNNMIVMDDEVWVPLEITLTDEGFAKAHRVGAREWRVADASGKAMLYKMQDSWKIYSPISAPGATASLNLPDSDTVCAVFTSSVNEWGSSELKHKLEPDRPIYVQNVTPVPEQVTLMDTRSPYETDAVIRENPFTDAALLDVLALASNVVAVVPVPEIKEEDLEVFEDEEEKTEGPEPEQEPVAEPTPVVFETTPVEEPLPMTVLPEPTTVEPESTVVVPEPVEGQQPEPTPVVLETEPVEEPLPEPTAVVPESTAVVPESTVVVPEPVEGQQPEPTPVVLETEPVEEPLPEPTAVVTEPTAVVTEPTAVVTEPVEVPAPVVEPEPTPAVYESTPVEEPAPVTNIVSEPKPATSEEKPVASEPVETTTEEDSSWLPELIEGLKELDAATESSELVQVFEENLESSRSERLPEALEGQQPEKKSPLAKVLLGIGAAVAAAGIFIFAKKRKAKQKDGE